MTPKPVSDERKGRPSSSIVERLWLCPGSRRMTRGLPELVTPEMAEWAETGDRIHLHLQSPDFVDLSDWPEDQDVADACTKQREALVERIFCGEANRPDDIREERLWLVERGVGIFSGKMDIAFIGDEQILICDYKTGRGDVEESATNLQLRSLAVLAYRNWVVGRKNGIKKISVAVIQPLISSDPEVCTYDLLDLAKSEAELRTILDRSADPSAPLNAGVKQCRFCPAKLRCPNAISVLEELEKICPPGPTATYDEAGLAHILNLSQLAQIVITAARGVAKETLKQGRKIPGWELKPGKSQREVGNAAQVYERLALNGLIDQPTFIAECVNVGLGDTEKAIAKFKAVKLAEAKKLFKEATDGCVSITQQQPVLVKVDEAPDDGTVATMFPALKPYQKTILGTSYDPLAPF